MLYVNCHSLNYLKISSLKKLRSQLKSTLFKDYNADLLQSEEGGDGRSILEILTELLQKPLGNRNFNGQGASLYTLIADQKVVLNMELEKPRCLNEEFRSNNSSIYLLKINEVSRFFEVR
jgi:hypothetical protein